MKENLNRIPFDFRQYLKKNQTEFEVTDFQFTPDELKYVPSFHDFHEASIHVLVMNAGSMMTLTFSVEGTCHLVDAHDGNIVDYDLDDEVDVIIAPDNEEENDIFPDEDGIYDLRGCVLALLYDAIPKNYSLVPLKKVEQDNYVVISEDDYFKEHKKSSSPFDDLDSNDY